MTGPLPLHRGGRYHGYDAPSARVVSQMNLAADTWIGPQVLTLVVPLGTLFVVLLWGFFQRRSSR